MRCFRPWTVQNQKACGPDPPGAGKRSEASPRASELPKILPVEVIHAALKPRRGRSVGRRWNECAFLPVGPKGKPAVKALVVVEEALVRKLSKGTADSPSGRTGERRCHERVRNVVRQHPARTGNEGSRNGRDLGHWPEHGNDSKRSTGECSYPSAKTLSGFVTSDSVRTAPWTVNRHRHPSELNAC